MRRKASHNGLISVHVITETVQSSNLFYFSRCPSLRPCSDLYLCLLTCRRFLTRSLNKLCPTLRTTLVLLQNPTRYMPSHISLSIYSIDSFLHSLLKPYKAVNTFTRCTQWCAIIKLVFIFTWHLLIKTWTVLLRWCMTHIFLPRLWVWVFFPLFRLNQVTPEGMTERGSTAGGHGQGKLVCKKGVYHPCKNVT